MSAPANSAGEGSLKSTLATGAALLALWALSWGLSYVDLGGWSLLIAFGIAAAKAAIVVLFFMEIARERTSVQATLVTGLVMIALLITFMVADVKTRGAPPALPANANEGRSNDK